MCKHRRFVADRNGQLTARISSRVLSSGESPPCMQRNCLLRTAERGRQQKESIIASYIRSEYLCLPRNMVHQNRSPEARCEAEQTYIPA